MKQTLLITALIIVFCSNIIAQSYTEYYFKFDVKNKSELDTITQLISIDNVKGLEVFAYANQQELETFSTLGYKIKFLKKDTPKSLVMATTVAEMAKWDRYPTYEVYRQLMKNFEINYPSICKLDSFGTTNNERKLYALKISDNVEKEENEPEFFYTSTMHGDETTGFILMLRLADSLLSSYSTSAQIENLVNEIEIYINPNANPDGTYYGGNNTVSGAIRYNGTTDLNRDFPDPRTGVNSSYQPETQAMMNFAEEHNFIMSANFHGGAAVMNYPWDTWYYNENPHSDTEWFEQVCTDYVTTARSVNSSCFSGISGDSDGVTHGATWYRVSGGRQDYMNFWHQCREITIELSEDKLLETEYLNNYWNYNKESLLNFMHECLYGIRGIVTDSKNIPLDAMIWVINHDSNDDSSMVYTDPDIGDYHRLIESGTYDIIASSDGYLNDTARNIVVTKDNSFLLNFKLTLNDDPLNFLVNPSKISDTLNMNKSKDYIVYIKNVGNTILDYSAFLDFPTKSETWINLNKENGSILPEKSDSVIITVSTDGISSGEHISTLNINEIGGKDYFIPINIFVNEIQSIGVIPNITEFKLYPNPFLDQLNIEFFTNESKRIKLKIFNICGNFIFEEDIISSTNTKNNIVLNEHFIIQSLPKGLYLIQLSSSNYQITKKVFKK